MLELDKSEFGKLEMCFRPQSAAIIGASTDPMKFGGRALKFCLERGYAGRLYPVNAHNEIVQGIEAYRSISDLPEAPDIAVIAVPAASVRENLIAAGEKGASIAIVYGAQFAESGAEGRVRQDELLRIAKEHDMRMIGPNCMGVISLASGFVASFTSAPEHHEGNGWPVAGDISVASQSGAVGIQIFAQLRDRGLGLANWISTGNQADIDICDAIAFYADDPATKTIAVYMEDASRGLKLVQALELARQARKPVVVLKVGTTPQGGEAATGHTASVYVEDRVVEDLFRQFGVLRAGSVNEMIDLVAACNARAIPSSPEVAAVSVSGGGAVMISDAAARNGLELPEYPVDALAGLKETNSFVNDRNPIDISAPSMSNMEITGGHLKWGLERDPQTMLGYISHVPLVPRTRDGIMSQMLTFQASHPDKLIAIAANLESEDRADLVRSGIAVFDDPTVMTEAVAKLVRTGKSFEKPSTAPLPPGEQAESLDAVVDILRETGIEVLTDAPVKSAKEAVSTLEDHKTIVLKLTAAGLKHRTELDGVRTNLSVPAAVEAAYGELAKLAEEHAGNWPDIHVTWSPHINGVEVLLAARSDPHFGPLVMLGSGGILCELLHDLKYRKPPFGEGEAHAMIREIRAERMLAGWRGAGPVNRDALAKLLVRMSKVADRLPSLEINPLFVTADRLVAADLVVDL